MREPRYPLSRVVFVYRRRTGPPDARRGWGKLSIQVFLGAFRTGVHWSACAPRMGGGARAECWSTPPARTPQLLNTFVGSFCCAGFDNDPSTGSPTETLLRLLLSLSDKVQWTSRDVVGSEPPMSPRSEHFTGSFNRLHSWWCPSVNSSTRVSPGFAPLRYSSPSFGSRQVCSHLNPSQKIKVGRWCTPREIPQISFLAPYGFTRPLTHTHVRLLGPCFKTGRMGSPQGSVWSAQMPKNTEGARCLPQSRRHHSMSVPRAQALAAPPIHAGPRIESIGGPARRRSISDRGASPASIRFPPDNFKHSLTLFSKSFSYFPRGTCSLSVSRPYFALDGIHRLIWAAFPNNRTRRQRLVVR
ncbi:Protein TAR1 [Capsicum baccatum]|uniref:Protein TAR1 n=1 Tax=Capsicum baccatum TaxID=33114 RepID=A0A2G2V6V2_CAPBA|nr:Protein TAR1 [Capsicum baccatum]